MTKRRPILIGCPQYQKLVRGTYECGLDGQYLLGPDGSFLIERARCGHDGGRCAQTLCVLHRYNRRGSGSWYPSRLVPVGRPTGAPHPPRPPESQHHHSDMDLLC